MILKAIAWTWLIILFLAITGLAIYAVLSQEIGSGASMLGFLWLFIALAVSVILSFFIITDGK